MKLSYLSAAALAAGLLATGASAAPAVTGDYVESRSANVYVGACHHEGEIQTAGRNAVMAWNITSGEFNGTDLKGVTAVAVVAADRNLGVEGAARRSVLYVSEQASPAQRDALVALLKERAPQALGELVAVKSAAVSFDASGDLYRVQVPGAAFMKIKKQTQTLCCKQPYVLWDRPFVPVKAAKAGYCVGVEFKDRGLLQAWSATDQNNAYFG
ncbi:MAG TPA: DUF1326 domain-containing protein, partial [Armatimonadota bacterium]|nr:DUF1326 domain-containing protein [Armatimonadota bacterium]